MHTQIEIESNNLSSHCVSDYKVYLYVRFAMDSFELEQSQSTAYLDFRQLGHLFASTFAILTNDLDFGNLGLSIDSIMFGSKSTHSPIQPQSNDEKRKRKDKIDM